MKYLIVILLGLISQISSAQVRTQFVPQNLGDFTLMANRYNLISAILSCDSCFVDVRTMRSSGTECASNIIETASPMQLDATCWDNLINQGSTQSTFVFKLPASPVNGQLCRLVFHNAVTTLGITDAGGSSLYSGSATSSSVFTYKYYSAASTWKRI